MLPMLQLGPKPPLDIYTELPPINNQRVKLTTAAPFTPTFVEHNVTRSSDPAQLYASRVRGRQILLDNPARESRTRKDRERKKAARAVHRARSDAGVIGKNQVREKGLWKLAPSETRFDAFLAIHHLWMDYMAELLALSPPPPSRPPADARPVPNASAMHAKLIKADFQGAIITVRQSKNPCLVGLSGIVVHETENAFKVVTERDHLKLIPKRNSIFAFSVPLYARTPPSLMNNPPSPNPPANTVADDAPMTSVEPQNHTVRDIPHVEFELYGNQFCFRSADRASRKFKHKETIEL